MTENAQPASHHQYQDVLERLRAANGQIVPYDQLLPGSGRKASPTLRVAIERLKRRGHVIRSVTRQGYYLPPMINPTAFHTAAAAGLTGTEALFLERLIQAKGAAVPFAAFQSPRDERSLASLKMIIHRIRKRGHPIEAVRGIGYRISQDPA